MSYPYQFQSALENEFEKLDEHIKELENRWGKPVVEGFLKGYGLPESGSTLVRCPKCDDFVDRSWVQHIGTCGNCSALGSYIATRCTTCKKTFEDETYNAVECPTCDHVRGEMLDMQIGAI